MMDENIRLTYLECTFFSYNEENYIEMLYQTMTPVDATKLKEVSEDHLFQEATILLHKVYCLSLILYAH